MSEKGEDRKPSLLPVQNGDTLLERMAKFYLIPEGPFLAHWNRFIVLVAILLALLTSFMAAFQYSSPAAWAVAYILDVCFLVDIWLKFHMAYLQGGFWVVFPKEMAMNYMKTYDFYFDIVANFPVDLIALGWAHVGEGEGKIEGVKVLALVRLWKLLRTVRVLTFFRRQENKLHASFSIQIVKFVVYLSLLTHLICCVWFANACSGDLQWDTTRMMKSCRDDSWVINKGWEGSSLASIYAGSLYWSLTTMTTTGYGDIHPENDSERIFALFTMTMGNLFFGYISGTVASTLSNMNARRVAYQQKMEAIRQYMADRDMDRDMQQRVLDYYDYVWERNRGIDVKNIFGDMPSTFKSEVALSLNNQIIDN
ncbi:Kinesin-like protein kif27, partial [Borealophlyctis nickersoniae]